MPVWAVTHFMDARQMFGPGERIEVDYTWNQSYCQSLAWSRMEHNQTRTFSVMVPKDATILEHGVKVRDGNDGSSWHKCDLQKDASCEGMGEISYLPIKDVTDNMLTEPLMALDLRQIREASFLKASRGAHIKRRCVRHPVAQPDCLTWLTCKMPWRGQLLGGMTRLLRFVRLPSAFFV